MQWACGLCQRRVCAIALPDVAEAPDGRSSGGPLCSGECDAIESLKMSLPTPIEFFLQMCPPAGTRARNSEWSKVPAGRPKSGPSP